MFSAWNPRRAPGLLLFLLLASIESFAAPAHAAAKAAEMSGTLVITGASTMAPLVAAIGERFCAIHPGVRVEVSAGGTGRGIADVANGKADIGMASRLLAETESALYSFAIGRDGVTMVLHTANPVRSLTNAQIRDIYVGKVVNWKQVGGKDAPIGVVNAKEGLGAVEVFTQFFGLRYADIKAVTVIRDNHERIRAITDNPNAVTYMSIGSAQKAADAGSPLKLLPIDGVAATARNLGTGNFPISRPLLLLTRQSPTGLTREFINFSLSSQITDLVLLHEFVPYLD